MTEPVLSQRGGQGVVSKRQDDHLQRLAMVSVRPSPPQQVVEPVESTARQYGVVDRAVALGGGREIAWSSLRRSKANVARAW